MNASVTRTAGKLVDASGENFECVNYVTEIRNLIKEELQTRFIFVSVFRRILDLKRAGFLSGLFLSGFTGFED